MILDPSMASSARMMQRIVEARAFKSIRLFSSRKETLSRGADSKETYPFAMKLMHWGVATGVLGCFGTAQAAMRTTKEYQPVSMTKGELMKLHKSFGLLVAAAITPRILLRISSTVPPELPGHTLELIAAKLGMSA